MKLLRGILIALMLTGCEQSLTSEPYRFEELGGEVYRINVKTGELALVDGDLLLPISEFPKLELTEKSEDPDDTFHSRLTVSTVGERLYYYFGVYHNPKKQWRSSEARLQFFDRLNDYEFFAQLEKNRVELYSFEMEMGSQSNNGRTWTGSVMAPRSALQNADSINCRWSRL